jgi:hypothetical protein
MTNQDYDTVSQGRGSIFDFLRLHQHLKVNIFLGKEHILPRKNECIHILFIMVRGIVDNF